MIFEDYRLLILRKLNLPRDYEITYGGSSVPIIPDADELMGRGVMIGYDVDLGNYVHETQLPDGVVRTSSV